MPGNRAPILAPISTTIGAEVNRSVALSSLLRFFDPDGDSITQYELRDDAAGGGHFVVNGVTQSAQQTITLTAAQLAGTTYVGGSESGIESFSMRAYDGQAWGAWMSSPVYTFERYAETAGTTGADVFSAGGTDRIYLGLGGADRFNVAANAEVVLMGGRGDDAYVVPANGTAIIYETGDSTNDTLRFGGWSVQNDNFVVALIENRHLLLADPTSGGSVLLYDWFKVENRIENFTFDAGDASFSDMIEFVVDGAVPNSVWNDQTDGALLDEAMAYYRGRLAVLENTSPISVADRTLRPEQVVAASDLVQASRPVARYELQDWDFNFFSGHFTLNGVQQASGSATFVVTAAQFAQLQWVASADADTREAIQVRADDGSGWGDWQSFIVSTHLNAVPVVRVSNEIVMKLGQSLAASALFSVDDADGDAMTQYEFTYSSQGAAAYFTVGGLRQTADQPFVVTAAQLGDVRIVGDIIGSDFVRIRAYDGHDWSSDRSPILRVSSSGNMAPVITPAMQVGDLLVGQSVPITQYFTAYDPEGVALTYTFTDQTRFTPDRTGYFTLNGVRQDTAFTVSTAQLGNVRFVAGSEPAYDGVSLSVSDGSLSVSATWAMNTTYDNDLPDVTASVPAVVMPGQKVQLASLFHAFDRQGDTFYSIVVTDTGNRPDSGYILYGGVRQTPNQGFSVEQLTMSEVQYVGGKVPGVETLLVSISSSLAPNNVYGMTEPLALRVTTAGIMQDGAGDTPQAARTAQLGTGAGAVTFNDYLGPNDFTGVSDTTDYYRLDLSRPGTLRLDLTGLGANADLKLLDANGATLASSARLGPTNDHISQAVGAGSFFVQVSAAQGVSTYYDLVANLVTNQAPTALTLTNVTATLAENTAVSASRKVADIAVTDDGSGANTLSIAGTDAAFFEIVGSSLFLKAGTTLDFESKPSYTISVRVDDVSVGATPDASAAYTLTLSDVNDNAPVITTAAARSVTENTLVAAALTSTDLDTVGTNPAAFSITGGADAARFAVTGGNLVFVAAPDFDNPSDSDRNNTYVVQVTAADGAQSVNRTITVTVSDLNDNAPSITTAAAQSVTENVTVIAALASTDVDTVGTRPASFTISGGADAARFAISNGNLVFAAAPDFENPSDVDRNNTYLVQVTASDGVNTASRTITTSVTNVIETMSSAVSATLPSSMENLTLTGSADVNGIGNALANVITGNAGRNVLTGGAGNDAIDGGLGVDTAVYSGSRESYTIAKNGATLTVSGADGVDTLRGVEFLQFGDVLVQADASRRDFNADGNSDILLREGSGALRLWQMDGVQKVADLSLANSANWTIAASQGDYNADGRSDIVLRNADTGVIVIFQMNGTQIAATGTLANSANWALIGTAGDYDGDGRSDLVLRNVDTGTLVMLRMNGTQVAEVQTYDNSANWTLAGTTGDYNGDGRSDLLLRNADSGQLVTLQMDGTRVAGVGTIANSANWTVVGTAGDYNADGLSDILLHNRDTGMLAVVQMNGTQVSATGSLANSANWSVVAAQADYDGDGRSDVILRNADSGALVQIEMNGTAVRAAQSYANSATWGVTTAEADYNGDGRADLLLQNRDSGALSLWLMNGMQIAQSQSLPAAADWTVAA